MSSQPPPEFFTARQTLDLLGQIRDTVRGSANREGTLNQGLRLNSTKRRQEVEEALETEATRLNGELEAAELAHAEATQAFEAREAKRSAWIERAHRSDLRRVADEVRSTEGQGKYDRQKQQIALGKGLEEALTQTQTFYAELAGTLEDSQRRSAGLERAARKAVRGYGSLGLRLRGALKQAGKGPVEEGDANEQIERAREAIARAHGAVGDLRGNGLALFFSAIPLLVLLILIVGAHAALYVFWDQIGLPGTPNLVLLGASAGGLSLLFAVLHFIGGIKARQPALTAAAALGEARHLLRSADHGMETSKEAQMARLRADHDEQVRLVDRDFRQTQIAAGSIRATGPEKIEAQHQRILARHEARFAALRRELDQGHEARLARIRSESDTRKAELSGGLDSGMSALQGKFDEDWAGLAGRWAEQIQPAYAAIQALNQSNATVFPDWSTASVEAWSPPTGFRNEARIGTLHVDVAALSEGLPADERLALPGPPEFDLPVVLSIPDQASLVVETRNSGRDQAIASLNNAVLRWLGAVPPGRVAFTLLDPVGLGESFSGLMHLADYEESLISSRIWTQSDQIDKRLAELNEHMEKVIQMYLRNEYESITQYNEEAGNIAEKYRFLVVADFPHGFSDQAVQRLISIATSGARCGVYTLIHWDRREPMPQGLKEDDLRHHAVSLTTRGEAFALADQPEGATLELETLPSSELASDFVHRVGKASVDSTRVEVPFDHIAPSAEETWSIDTTEELRIPIGRTGATKLQYLAMGKGTRQHALIAGKTGSGKSTLFHVMITNMALWADPDHVEFYLIDFKKGVEFKAYATHRLPHAKVIAIESDREFGLSVLQRVDEELKRRGDLFRQLGAQDIAGYQRAGGTEPMPRTLLLIDEFQEFFVEDDKIAQGAQMLLDRIVRQGRAFGIHAILGSQTLGGAFTVGRATMGQMVIRIALQCNEADSYLIMDDSNPAARLLSRPGEGIYNDNAGAIEGNSPFQVVWIPEDVRDERLRAIRERADASGRGWHGPVVFEGNAPADVRENSELVEMLAGTAEPAVSGKTLAYLGAPNSIKGPAAAAFIKQSGNNLLMVGQRDEAALAIFAVGMVSLSAQYPAGGVRFLVLDGTAPDTPERRLLETALAAVPHEVQLLHQNNLDEPLHALAEEMRARGASADGGATGPTTYVFIYGLQRFKKLRHEDDFSFSLDDAPAGPDPAVDLGELITDGPAVGIHLLAYCDTFNNVNRFLSRKILSEFEMRVVFQMSANDSASLIDSPKASNLGLNRALFYNEQEGILETFRPYAMPDGGWFDEVRAKLAG